MKGNLLYVEILVYAAYPDMHVVEFDFSWHSQGSGKHDFF
jgi:hypothetical protein